METLNVLDKEKTQNRLSKYFDTFREEEINGVPFNLLPPKEDIPLIKQVSYDRQTDVFEIVFEYEQTVRVNQQGNIAFIEDLKGRLVGIQVNQLRKNDINKITLEIIASLDKVIKAARIKLETNSNPKEVVAADLEQRKVDFFKDIVQQEMPNLVK